MSDRPYVSFIEVKAKVTIPDVMEALGIRDQFREKNGALVGVCPLPQHQHGPRPNSSQFVADDRQGLWLYRCFGDCAETEFGGGDVITFAKAMTGYKDEHIRFWFSDYFGERLDGKTMPKARAKRKAPKKETRGVGQEPPRASGAEAPTQADSTTPEATANVKPLRFRLNLDPDVPYLRQRGLLPETIERFGLGLASRGSLAGYVAIPVFRYPRASAEENAVAYLGRWPGDDHDEKNDRPRYKWPADFKKSHVIYALEEALTNTSAGDPLIVVEGVFSVFALWQHGCRGVVATFGASLSDEQAKLLIGTRRPIVLMYDGGEAGHHGMRAAAGKLIREAFVRAVKLDDGMQPDHLKAEELRSLLPR